jgi:hypothetical protein
VPKFDRDLPPLLDCFRSAFERLGGSFSIMRKRLPYGDLDGRICGICSFQTEGSRWWERRLGQKARRSAAVLLRSVDQEGVTEVDRPRFARRQSHLPLRADISQLQAGHSRFPGRGQIGLRILDREGREVFGRQKADRR